MLAPARLPPAYATWNRRHHAPAGRRGKTVAWRLGPRHRAFAHYLTPYGWQRNTDARSFEYPWAFAQTAALGERLDVVEVGAGLSGLQFSLARAGHRVHAVDPGLAARGRGWELDPALHRFLARVYRAPVALHPTTLAGAGLADASVDVLASISAIEHFAPADLDELAAHARRVLRPGAHLVLTIDLFLDLAPFTSRERNEYGVNVDVRALLDSIGARPVNGTRAEELYGFPEFDPDRVQSELSRYFVGSGYPALSQCVVAQVPRRPGP